MFRVKTKSSHLTNLKHVYKPITALKLNSVPLHLRRTASTASSRGTGIRIAAGITALCGGGLLGGAALYNYNADFRNFVNTSLPIIETFNLALGPVVNTNNTEDNKVEEVTFQKSKDRTLKPIIEVEKSDTHSTPKKETPKKSRDTASISSVDQASISAVDLEIAKAVEDEVQSKAKKPEPPSSPPSPPPKSKQPAKPAHVIKGQPPAAISAFDQVGVSSADLDIVRKVDHIEEQKPIIVEVTPKKEPEPKEDEKKPSSKETISGLSKENVALSKPLETGLTEKEVEEMVDQTAMEVLIEEGLLILKMHGEDAVAAQQKATEAVLTHVSNLKTALEKEAGSMKDLSRNVLSSQKAAEESIEEAKASQLKLNQEVEKFHHLIKEAEAAGASGACIKASEEAARVSYGVLNASAELQKAKAEDMVLGEYQKFFEESKGALKKELEEVMPGAVKEGKGKGKKGADKDTARTESVLLAYARKRLEHLKQELAHHRQEEQKRLEQILSVQRDEDAKLGEIRLQQERDRLKADFEVELKKKEAKLLSNYETDLRQQLRRQAAAYSDHLTEVLKVQAAEMDERHQAEMEHRITDEKNAFSAKLTAVLSRLRGVESAISMRAEIEEVNKRSQELWIACQALNAAIDRGYEVRRPLKHEIEAVYQAYPSDPVVNTVLESIPSEAIENGVHSEENLASRFPKVRRQCKRVAMIGDTNAGLWSYVISYLQSFFIFDGFDPTKEGDLVDIEEMDTFGLLSRAHYYLTAGDLELAARFVNQLKGEPRQLAYDWLREARLLLETRQAARFLASYAAAAGMGGTGV